MAYTSSPVSAAPAAGLSADGLLRSLNLQSPATPVPAAFTLPQQFAPEQQVAALPLAAVLLAGLRAAFWAIRNPRVMSAVGNWIQQRAASQIATHFVGTSKSATTACHQACKTAIEKTLSQAPRALGTARNPRDFLDKLRVIADRELSVALRRFDETLVDTIKAAYKDALESAIKRALGTAKDYAIAGFTGATGIKIWESLSDKPGGNGDSKKTKLPSPEQLRNLANELEAKRSRSSGP
jgi:hypothetical protein